MLSSSKTINRNAVIEFFLSSIPASTASLAGSITGSIIESPGERPGSPEGSCGTGSTHEEAGTPLSSLHKRKQFKHHTRYQVSESSISISMRGGSIASLHQEPLDDGFHQIGSTVIVPMNQGQPAGIPVNTSRAQQRMGRFSVSPAQSIPHAFLNRQKSIRTPTRSECSTTHESSQKGSREPSMQFKMSATSLHEDLSEAETPKVPGSPVPDETQRPLLMDYLEVVGMCCSVAGPQNSCLLTS